MGMSAFYVVGHDVDASLKTISRAVELGCNHLDTAWIYKSQDAAGEYHNETLVGKAIAALGREKLIIATKFGIDFANPKLYASDEASIRRQLAESLARLGTDYVDLYYQHRQDPATPIEEVARVLAALRAEGKIKYIGFSEITPDELRRAAAICPVSAIQVEYSLQTRGIETGLLPAARELGVGIVAYSPLGRGLLSRTFASLGEIKGDDWRATLPRFNAAENYDATAKFAALGDKYGLPPATLALAWLLSKGEDIFPIPGSKAVERLEQNVAAAHVALSPEQLAEVELVAGAVVGDRYPAAHSGSTWENRL
jgi:aryl-alcohol dehydrogenase-like predicted oxidoreductase